MRLPKNIAPSKGLKENSLVENWRPRYQQQAYAGLFGNQSR